MDSQTGPSQNLSWLIQRRTITPDNSSELLGAAQEIAAQYIDDHSDNTIHFVEIAQAADRNGRPAGFLEVRVGVSGDRPSPIPLRLQGVPIRPVQATPFIPSHRLRPLTGGASLGSDIGGHSDFGTLGCFADIAGIKHLVTAAHVFERTIHDKTIIANILQPAPFHRGTPLDVVADSIVLPIGMPFLDVAAAPLKDQTMLDPQIHVGQRIKKLHPPIAIPTKGVRVGKLGKASGPTIGHVRGFVVAAPIDYPLLGRQVLFNHFRITGSSGSFSRGGDSGSLVYTDSDSRPLGMIIAGARGQGSLCVRLDEALLRLGATLVY